MALYGEDTIYGYDWLKLQLMSNCEKMNKFNYKFGAECLQQKGKFGIATTLHFLEWQQQKTENIIINVAHIN